MNIAISGKKGSGKDSVGKMLANEYGYTVVHLANPLKHACCALFSFSLEQVLDQTLKETVDKRWGFTPRSALETAGTAMRRAYGNDIFVRLFFAACDAKQQASAERLKFVCCDLRYPDEAVAFKARGWKVMRIDRPRVYDPAGSRPHDSQVALDTFKNFDVRVMNDSSLDVLFRRVKNAFDLAI